MVASIELQKAIFERLSKKYDVFEIKKPNHPKPYIQIGEESLDIVDTKTHERTLHNITLITYSTASSSLESKQMNDFVIRSISRDRLFVNGFSVDMQELDLQVVSREDKTDVTEFRTIITFNITLTKK